MQNLWLIWKNPLEKSRRRFRVGLLSAVKDKNGKISNFIFKYTNPELDDAKREGFSGFPGFNNLDVEKTYKTNDDTLFTSIEQRLPDSQRADYLDILNNYNLDVNSSSWDILTATKGRLITDSYEFVPEFDRNKIEFDLAGSRHRDDFEECKKKLSDNDKLFLELEPENESDHNAVKVIYKDANGEKRHIGYVPRYYSKELTEILKNGVKYSAMISKLRREARIKDEEVSVKVKLIFR